MTEAENYQTLANDLPRPWLVASDLDGTLLDHFSYSHEAVDALLAELEAQHVPVVFNTSKTCAELVRLRHELHNRHPFIVENGSAIYVPGGYFSSPVSGAESAEDFECITLGRSRREILNWLDEARRHYGFQFLNFAELSVEAIMDATGLDHKGAVLASEREYSEALQWQDSAANREAFCSAAQQAGFRTLQGGRFLHLLGRCDKGAALQRLAQEYARQEGQNYGVIAAGDGNNDVDMLEVADLAVIVRSPAHDFPKVSANSRVLRTEEYGPKGWAEVLGPLLNHY